MVPLGAVSHRFSKIVIIIIMMAMMMMMIIIINRGSIEG